MTAPALAVQIQGKSSVSADNLNTYEQTCGAVADLRAFPGAVGVQVFMRGYSVPNDGGQGNFYWNPTATAADDGGVTTIQANSVNPGRWIRITTPAAASNFQIFLNVAAVRANTNSYPVIYMEGYRTGNDGGQGFLYLNAGDTTSADNGGTIFVDASGHRWYRTLAGLSVSPEGYAEWFGAYGDGTHNDAMAINNALLYCEKVYLLAKTYFIGGTTIQPPQLNRSLIGAGMDLTFITFEQTTQDAIYWYGMNAQGSAAVSDSLTGWELGGFTIENMDTSPPTGGVALHIVWCSYGKFRDIKVFSAHTAFQVETLQNFEADHLSAFFCYRVSMYITGQVLGGAISNVWCYGLNSFLSPSARTALGLYIDPANSSVYIEGVEFTNCNFVFHVQNLAIDGTSFSWRVGQCNYLRFVDCFFDTSNTGNTINFMRDSKFIGCWFASSGDYGVQIEQTDGCEFTACQAFNNANDGVVVLATAVNFKWRGGMARGNSIANSGEWNGINVQANTTDFLIDGVTAKNGSGGQNTQGWGIIVQTGSSIRYIITNNLVGGAGNINGGVFDGGAGVQGTSKNVQYNF